MGQCPDLQIRMLYVNDDAVGFIGMVENRNPRRHQLMDQLSDCTRQTKPPKSTKALEDPVF